MMKVKMGRYRKKTDTIKRSYMIVAGFGLLALVLVVTFFLYMGRTRGVDTTDARTSGDVGDFAYGQMNLELPYPDDISVAIDKGARVRWVEEEDPQIIGYNIYRYNQNGGTGVKVNMSIVSDTVYFDDDGTVFNSYAVSAVDNDGREGRTSEPVAAVTEPFTLEGLAPTATAEIVEDITFEAGSSGSPQPSLPADIVNCTAEGMSYEGVWYLERYTEVIGGTLMVTPYYGDNVSYTFRGDTVTVIATKHYNYGIMDAYVDDELWQTVDLFAQEVQPSQEVFTAIGLGAGLHKIDLVCTGQKNPQAYFNFINLEALKIQ
ncbi:MAG: hypothetical protein SWK76_06520 [Actinomycetota bacterium]|nr:hypothetical protein [Actinomycetota bacterium]